MGNKDYKCLDCKYSCIQCKYWNIYDGCNTYQYKCEDGTCENCIDNDKFKEYKKGV